MTNKNKQKNNIGIILIGFLAIVLIGGILIYMKSSSEKPEDKTAISDTNETDTTYPSETIQNEANTMESIENHAQYRETLDYLTDSFAEYPTNPEDFVLVNCPEADYSIMYPKHFFEEGYYDYQEHGFTFVNKQEDLCMTVVESEPPFKGKPHKSANYLYDIKKALVDEDSIVEDFYGYKSKEVGESGFSRSIVAGQLIDDPGHGNYVLHVCDNERVYTLTFYYPLDESITNGMGFDYTLLGYVLDCCYRGFSISGSTYKLRNYNEYLIDDMGQKK